VSKKVLDVGQCDADHFRISVVLDKFDVEIFRAHSHDQALKLAVDHSFDLILINRIMDADRTPGMDVLHSLKSQPSTAEAPAMIVSNFEEAQKAAIESGAVTGFGKANIDHKETSDLLAGYLNS